MEDLEQRKESLVEDFSMFDEWLDKYQYIIELGHKLPPFPEEKKTEDRKIKGCQSNVWLDYKVQNGVIDFSADSDALITKGIISMLVGVYSGCRVEQIAADDFAFVEQLGLRENLTPTRANGLASMIEKIKDIARKNLK